MKKLTIKKIWITASTTTAAVSTDRPNFRMKLILTISHRHYNDYILLKHRLSAVNMCNVIKRQLTA